MSLTEDTKFHNTIFMDSMKERKMKMEELWLNLNHIKWNMNSQCNFQCHYCISAKDLNNNPTIKPIDISKLSEALNFLKGNWHIGITGGEPFLEKDIIDICRVITKKHYLSLLTNLSTKNVYHFADHIDPNKVIYINAAVHIIEREKRDIKLNAYIEKMLYLQKKGFNINALYVAHPVLFDRIKADIAYLKSN